MQPRKHSKQKDAILSAIQKTKSHPTAQWIYEQAKPAVPALSLGTVYRNLAQFQQDGLVVQVGVVNGEQRFDGTVASHPHFICEACGSVIDLPMEDISLVIDAQGHSIDYRKTVYYGTCQSCSQQYATSIQ